MSTATYARRKAEGRCGRCGERAPRDAGTLCQSCCDGTRARAAMERAHDRAKRRCLFKGCDNRHYANGYCAGHSCQIRQGRPLAPLQEQRQWTDEELANVVRWRGEGRRWTWIAAALVATMGQMRGLMARKKALAGLTCREAPVSLLDWEPAPNDELPDPDEATALPEALERCPRCFLCLPHDGCLPGAYEVASRRQEAA